ncbi:MAG TPA: alpha/beta hydrolase [Chitinophaga sp.]
MKKILVAVLLTGFTYCTKAQEKIYLYPEQKDLHIGGRDKVQEAPFIEHFSASAKNGAAVLVIPGGGYTFLAEGHEGKDIARFFNSKGYDAIVLHYRVNDDAQQGARYPAQYNDATLAMRMIKSKAADWGLNPDKVGVIGFSAGGHLASCVATMIQPGTKPAFAILVYPVISMDTPYKHAGSAMMLLGPQPAQGMVDSLSTQNRVSEQTPPTMLIHSTDDKVVPIENSLQFYNALRAHHVPATLHVYDHGGHGYGLAVKDPVLSSWPELCITWLQGLGIK